MVWRWSAGFSRLKPALQRVTPGCRLKLLSMPPTTFSPLLQPHVHTAAQALDALLADYGDRCAPSARAGLLAQLECRLSEAVTPTLRLLFAAFCAVRDPLRAEQPADVSAHPLYPLFVQHIQQQGLAVALREFPVLCSLLDLLSQYWLAAATELCQRLRHDSHALAESFGALGPVIAIRAGLSDAHQQGRTVICLTFANGTKLIYKPRDVGLEAAWFALLAWINQRYNLLPLRVLRLLPRPGYGWVEYVAEESCLEQAAVRRYYHRAGMLLCCLYLWQGSDMHHENLLCAGEQPILIDLECLFQPQSRWQSQMLTPTRFSATVLRTHFLPAWEVSLLQDSSGLGGTLPLLNGQPVDPSAYSDAIASGFCALYRRFLADGAALVRAESPLLPLAEQCTRPILRDTAVYAALRQRSLQPELLRHADERQRYLLQRLSAAIPEPLREREAARCAAEAEALMQLDIPRFEVAIGSTDLLLPMGERSADCFTLAPLAEVRQRLLSLSAKDMAAQRYWLRGTLHLRQHALPTHSRNTATPLRVGPARALRLRAFASKNRSWFHTRALALAAQLERMAVPAADGSVTWITLHADQYYRFRPHDYFLYDGNVGVALFLAAVESMGRSGRYRDLIYATLAPLQRTISAGPLPPQIAIGGTNGLGGLVYALVRISTLLNDPALLTLAQLTAAQISVERIERDQHFDLFDGAAGAILGLLGLYEATHDPKLLERAGWCGAHLRTGHGRGDGMAHGAAGIAYSLARLFAATGRVETERCAVPHLSAHAVPVPPALAASYCQGTAGIGLAHLGILATEDTPALRAELERLLEATVIASDHPLDVVCCGNFGRYEFMIETGKRLQRPELIASARKQAAQAVVCSGTFRLFNDLPATLLRTSFFQGLAGIGYTLLRLADPERLPCVLLWE
ncbi:MAG: type 2 lantipeptide synthetase LanM [Candidatus Viridilinea halotolerans]|uniref:Type 2 lantipeptide synthetase LanM n=1 Tax=Candidatus Viridilinea halotolerans TaxID=2491704 RepID=A0A426TU91_9CHLR|nr:MAG: type 2 lantipeptide synthetase LanM [Candidatus Viridilinea halotolerans]